MNKSKSMTNSTKNVSITLLHIIGMTMILLCHYCQEEKIYFLSEIFISGVPLFLFTAGYLSGLSNIKSPSIWISKKIKRILIPFWLFVIVIYAIYEIINYCDVSAFQWIFTLLNLQGLNYTVWKFNYFGAISGCGHLWYLTTIMLCYFLVPLVGKIKIPKLNNVKKVLVILLLLGFQLVLMYAGFQLSYIISFFLGFFVAKNPVRTDIKWYGFITALMLVASVTRIVLRHYFDNTDFYVRFYALISCAIIGIWVFYSVFFFNDKFKSLFEKFNCKPILFIEKISYYVYITHYIFLGGPFSVFNVIENRILCYLAATFLSLFSATLLYLVTEKIIFKLLFKNKVS